MLSIDHFQVFLDAISDCFINCEFYAWEACVDLPISIVTTAGTITIKRPERLRENSEHCLTTCRVLNIDAIVRWPLNLRVYSDGKVLATYEKELLSRGYRALSPYQSSALLPRQCECLKICSMLNASCHHAWTGVYPGEENARQATEVLLETAYQRSLKSAS